MSNAFSKISDVTALAWVESYFLCDPREPLLRKNGIMGARPHMHDLHMCFGNTTLGWAHQECYARMAQSCRDHDVVLIKTIRFRLDWTLRLLDNYPNLKVLFLVRY